MPTDKTAKSDETPSSVDIKGGTGREKEPNEEVPAKNEERALRIAQIAATLATRHVSTREEATSVREDHPSLNSFYESLIIRARDLFDRANQEDPYVYAYELFEPRKHYSTNQIVSVFQQAGWAGMSSRNRIEAFIEGAVAGVRVKYDREKNSLKDQQGQGKISDWGKGRLGFVNRILKLYDDSIIAREATGSTPRTVYAFCEILHIVAREGTYVDKVRRKQSELKSPIQRFPQEPYWGEMGLSKFEVTEFDPEDFTSFM